MNADWDIQHGGGVNGGTKDRFDCGKQGVTCRKIPTPPTEGEMWHPLVDFAEMKGCGLGHRP